MPYVATLAHPHRPIATHESAAVPLRHMSSSGSDSHEDGDFSHLSDADLVERLDTLLKAHTDRCMAGSAADAAVAHELFTLAAEAGLSSLPPPPPQQLRSTNEMLEAAQRLDTSRRISRTRYDSAYDEDHSESPSDEDAWND